MSAVRMCDKCGTIYPEGAEGASTGQVTVNERDQRGKMVANTKTMDICPMCGMGQETPTPRLAVTGSADRIEMRDRATPPLDPTTVQVTGGVRLH